MLENDRYPVVVFFFLGGGGVGGVNQLARSNCFIHRAGACINLVLTNGACRSIHSSINLFSVSNCSFWLSKL